MEKTITPIEESNWPWPTEKSVSCLHCGSSSGQWRGYRNQKHSYVHRRRCNDCGRWAFKYVAVF